MDVSKCTITDLKRAEASMNEIRIFLDKIDKSKRAYYPAAAVKNLETSLEDNYQEEAALVSFIERHEFNPNDVIIRSVGIALGSDIDPDDGRVDISLFSDEPGFKKRWHSKDFLARAIGYLLYKSYLDQVKSLEEITTYTDAVREKVNRLCRTIGDIYGPIKEKLDNDREQENRLKDFGSIYSNPRRLSLDEKSISRRLLIAKNNIENAQIANSSKEREIEINVITEFGEEVKLESLPGLYAQWLLSANSVYDLARVDSTLIEGIMKKFLGSINDTNHIELLNVLSSLPYIFKSDSWSASNRLNDRVSNLPKWRQEWDVIKYRLFDIFENAEELGKEEEILSKESIEGFITAIYFWGWDKEERARKFLDKYEKQIAEIIKREAEETDLGYHRNHDHYSQKQTFFREATKIFPGYTFEEEVYVKGLALDYKVISPSGEVFYIEYDGQNHYSRDIDIDDIKPTSRTLRKIIHTDKQSPDITVFRVPYYNVLESLKYIKSQLISNILYSQSTFYRDGNRA